ncbi:MAG: hypothetical protein ACM30G_21225, partial [Micromonosporaceae bacterium]
MAGTLAVRPSAVRARQVLPAVRVRPVPPLEPPTDDERLAAGLDEPVPGMPELPLEFPARARNQITGLAPAEALRARRVASGIAAPAGTAGPDTSGHATASRGTGSSTTTPAPPDAGAVDGGLPPGVPPARLAVRRFV